MPPWGNVVRESAAAAPARLQRRRQELRAKAIGRNDEATGRPLQILKLVPQSPLHPLAWKQAEAYVALGPNGYVNFELPPLSGPAEGYVRVASTCGMAGLTLAWRLPATQWPQWLDGSAIEAALDQLGAECDRDVFDDVGEFLLRRWPRLRGHKIELGEAPPDPWQLTAVEAAALSFLRSTPEQLLPAGAPVLAVAPERLRPAVLLGEGGLAAPYGTLDKDGCIRGKNLYGAAVERALNLEHMHRRDRQ
jgi:hypothetical protein